MAKSGIVRNIIVDDVDTCSIAFARFLCRNQISYVHVDNEFHCLDKILRFYDHRNICELDCDEFQWDNSMMITAISIMAARGIEDLGDLFLPRVDSSFEDNKKERVVYTKKMLKQSSKMVNDKIRNNRYNKNSRYIRSQGR